MVNKSLERYMIKNVKMHYIVLLITKLVVIERVARKSKAGGERCEEC